MKIVESKNLSKKYVLGGRHRSHTLRDLALRPFRTGSESGVESQVLWALRDVSFDIEKGETVGLIGNNGAGKSTLLKILSRIVKPTNGEVLLRGRVGSLLEVGTGFHRELSGRENVFLNGAVLGMKRVEIKEKFDEIVAFSEVEQFLDTPIKFYSTGMFMRLAFSVAAHLNPEILLVDEVLAVGDLAFQRKCLRKMRDIGETGRTIVFVSHNMQAVTRLCSRAIWLEDGVVKEDGESKKVVSNYLNSKAETAASRTWEDGTAPGNEKVRLRMVRVYDENDDGHSAFDISKPVYVELRYEVLQKGIVIVPSIQLFNEEGVCLFTALDADEKQRTPREKGRYTNIVEIPGNLLAEGSFRLGFGLAGEGPFETHVVEQDLIGFMVADPIDGDSARGDFGGQMTGLVRPLLKWETRREL